MYLPEPVKLSNGDWFIRLRLGGENVPVTESTAKKCADTARSIKAAYKLDGHRRKTDKSLSEAINIYIDSRRHTTSPSTIRGYNSIRDCRFLSVADKPIKDINNWQELCNKEALNISPKYLRNAWGLVSSTLRFHGLDVPKITLPQKIKYDSPYLEPEQIPLFMELIKGERCELVALLALHSLRRSEIYADNLEKNIDLKAKRIKVSGAAVYDESHKLVNKKSNKNETSTRYIPILTNRLCDVIREHKKKGMPFLPESTPKTILKEINSLCKNNNLPEVGFHGLRHSFASLAYHLNVPIMIAMQIGGWKDYNTMLKIYTHLSNKDVEKYGGELREFFESSNSNILEKPTQEPNNNIDNALENALKGKNTNNRNTLGA